MPATWTENAVKSNSNSVIKIEHKTKQKQDRYGVGNKIIEHKMWEYKQKLNIDKRPFDEVENLKWKLFYKYVLVAFKANWCGGCEAGSRGTMHKDGTKSSSLLRIVVIQTIDIFMRGCYL